MFRSKKIPSLSEVNNIMLKNKELNLEVEKRLNKKTVELSDYLVNKYAPYLEKFEKDCIIVYTSENEYYRIEDYRVCYKSQDVIIMYDYLKQNFIDNIDKIIEHADNQIIEWFNKIEKDNLEKTRKINSISSVVKDK